MHNFCLLYLTAPYSDPSSVIRLLRYREVNIAVARLIAAGYGVISLLSMGVTIAAACPELATDWGTWKNTCLRMIERCDAICILPLPGWEKSIGVQAELEYARALGFAICFVTFPTKDQVMLIDSAEWREL